MEKTFTKGLFLLLLPLLVITAAASAQTITVDAIDPGPYGRGSSITLPFHIDNTAGCIPINNTFRLVLSNAAGSFAAGTTVLTTKTGFYETFLNGIIPQTAVPGGAYRLRIESTSTPNSLPSNAFTISTDPAITAAVSSTELNGNPGVFGACIGTNNTSYPFINNSTAGATVNATFFNEITQAFEGGAQPIPVNFIAKLANYTVTVKADKGGVIGTKSYTLINNDIYRSIGNSGSNTACANGTVPLSFPIPGDDGNGNGFKYNYPGLLYTVNWGDGSAPVTYTYCDIVNQGNSISHLFTTSSCGNNIGNQKNVFKVELAPSNPLCGTTTVTPGLAFAKVVTPPNNVILGSQNACTNTEVTFTNGSDPGGDPNSTSADCKNTSALYSWYINGVAVELNKKVTEPFVHKFLTHGSYTVTLKLQNPTGCSAADKDFKVCIQDPPQPKFDIPLNRCLSDLPLTPIDQSIVDPGCDANTPVPTYKWIQTGGPVGGVTFNAALKIPSFTFNAIGVYKFRLEITTASCGTVSSIEHTIVVNDAPKATLDQDRNICGQGVTLSFDPAATTTKSVLDGTAQPAATTYTWTVTGGAFAFVGGTNLHSQYPKIRFDALAAYTITATHVNNCGPLATDQQILTFVQAPTVIAGTYTPVCQGTQIALNGSPGVGGLVTGVSWLSTSGGTFTNQNSPNAIYNPSAADIAAGQVTLTYQVTTSLAAPCNVITDQTTITIIKTATVTSSPTPPPICSGSPFSYTITPANPATTFTWSAVVTSGTATGYPANGGTSTITAAAITNTGTGNTDAIITYTILPTLNGCPGTPFTLKVTVHPLPVITAVPVASPICSGEPANITLTSNITPTTYTWTFVATNGITGATNHPTATTVASIQDVLVNNSGTQGTVTYTITPYNGTCPGAPQTATIKVNPAPVTADAGPDLPVFVCPGTYQLQGNNPSPGTGVWSPVAGITFSDKNDPHAIASGLLPGQTYQFTWTITAAVPGCPPSFDVVTVTRNNAAVGGTTATITPTVCASTDVVVTLTGQVGTIVWQRSIDGGLNWANIPNQTTATLTYPNITQTTQFRAAVTSGACGVDNSTVTTITVVQPPPAANAGTYGPLCSAPSVPLSANDPGTFIGEWKQVGGPTANILIAQPNNAQTLVTGLTPGNTYQFQWTIYAKSPCVSNSVSVATIVNGADVTPNFTPITQVCGSGLVNFTNTTIDVPGTQYLWEFGDGETSTLKNPSHSFQPNTDGTDRPLTVSLTVINSCGSHLPKTADIIVSPATPVVVIIPSTAGACGSLSLTVKNQSPGTNKQYDFFLVDENGVEKGHVTRPDKTDAVFPTVNIDHSARWFVYMEATNNCGAKNPNPFKYPIDVAPSDITPIMSVKDGQKTVCLGSPVTFINLTSNATTYYYRFYDADKNFLYRQPAGQEDYSYTFPNTGLYYVTLSAEITGCNGGESDFHDIQVVPLPQPDFDATVDIDNNATFENTTPDAGSTPRMSLVYEWNFGDGSPVDHNFTPAKHFYKYENSPYTVTLTATIPGNNCSDIKVKTVTVKFSGELFLPNAFQPAASKTELRTFKAKGQKLKEWRMQIFNNWGQLVWQTTALNSNGEPVEGWDGTFKGAPAQQGVYIWQITARFLNGSDWRGMSYKGSLPKRTGTITLIR
jgi:hypothetical protein